MKKLFKGFAGICSLILICLSHPVNAQFTDAERMERCQNNKNRIAELESQIQVINADLAASMTKKETEVTEEQLKFVRVMKNDPNAHHSGTWNRVQRIMAQYNFDFKKCFDEKNTGKVITDPGKECYKLLENMIVQKLNKAHALISKEPGLINKKNEINKQLSAHRSNLVALSCDNPRGKSAGSCKIAGRWTQETPGVGSTVWEIKSDGTATETGIGYAKGKASLKGPVLHIDWQTGTGYSGYYEWTLDGNCSSGTGSLVFKTGRTDTLRSTVKKN